MTPEWKHTLHHYVSLSRLSYTVYKWRCTKMKWVIPDILFARLQFASSIIHALRAKVIKTNCGSVVLISFPSHTHTYTHTQAYTYTPMWTWSPGEDRLAINLLPHCFLSYTCSDQLSYHSDFPLFPRELKWVARKPHTHALKSYIFSYFRLQASFSSRHTFIKVFKNMNRLSLKHIQRNKQEQPGI